MSETNELYDAVHVLARQAEGPNLPALSYALRHPETWPEGFVWDYGNCRTCAVGLTGKLWCKSRPSNEPGNTTWIAAEMAMPYRDAQNIFFFLGRWRTVKNGWFRKERKFDRRQVTPDDVADAIDRYLASAG